MQFLKTKHIGAILGLLLGLAFHYYGFEVTVFLAAMTALGWTLGRAADGEIDLSEMLRRRSGEDLE